MDRDRALDLLSIANHSGNGCCVQQGGLLQESPSQGYVPLPPGTATPWNEAKVSFDKEFIKPGCSPNSHVFECRHELRCRCGQTYRAEALAVPKGL